MLAGSVRRAIEASADNKYVSSGLHRPMKHSVREGSCLATFVIFVPKPCSRSTHCKRYEALLLQDIAGSLYIAIGTVVALLIVRVQCLACKGSQASCCQLSSANQSPLILINSLSSVRALAFMGWCRAHHSDKNKLARPASDADC